MRDLHVKNHNLKEQSSKLKGGKNNLTGGIKKETSFKMDAISKSMINSTQFLCIITDAKGIIQFINHGIEVLLGFRAEEVSNKLSILEIIDEQDLHDVFKRTDQEGKNELDDRFDKTVLKPSQGSEILISTVIICKDSSHLRVDFSVTAQFDEKKQVISYLFIGAISNTFNQVDIIEKEIDKKIIEYIDKAPSGIFIVDGKGNYLMVNKSATMISGYSKNELLKMNRNQLIYPGERAYSTESFNKLMEDGQAIIDSHILTKDGKDRYWRINVIKINRDRYVGIVNDITDQKLAQDELKKINKYLETIVENIPNMLFLKDAKELSFVQFNKAGEELIGFSRDDMLGKNDFDFFPKEQAEFFRNKDREVLDGKYALYIEEELIQTRFKGERILHTKKVPIVSADGVPEFLLGISEDITERKQAEKEFLQKKMELDNFFSLSPNLLCIAERKFIFTRVNIVWEKLFGYTFEELLQMKYTDLIHPDDLTETNLALSTLSKEHPVINFQNRCLSKTGVPIWIEWHVVTTDDQLYAIGRDINNKIFYEEELKKSKEAAEAASRAKSDFLANMSHEIRNPMNSIIGFAELLHNNITDHKLLSQVDSIRNSGKVLLGILNDILDLSKIEAGKMKLEMEPVNLNFLIKDIENMFSQKIHEKGLSFCVEKDADLSLKLMLDEVRLRQILFNLIGNALKFTDKGYICLALNKVYKNADSIDLMISIQDSGIGIPKDQHMLVFETFQQQEGQKTKKFGGTGLGLSISKRLAEMMGGKITLSSEPGKGSIFKLTLYDVKILHDEIAETKEYVFNPNAVLFDNATVLIVDDSELNLDLIVMTLENSNLNLLTAKNGKEAIRMTQLHHPDLILMDLRMPLLNGYEAARIIKSDIKSSTIPIIAISASTDVELKQDDTVSHFDGYMMKPIRLTDFIELIKKFLPYKTLEATQQKERKPKEIYNLTTEQKGHLIDIIKTLETEFLPINEIVIKKQLIEQIDLFGKRLALFGETNSLTFITEYGNKICRHVDNFEIDKMMKTLKLFPEIIERVKTMDQS